jgi:hypothetical protein
VREEAAAMSMSPAPVLRVSRTRLRFPDFHRVGRRTIALAAALGLGTTLAAAVFAAPASAATGNVAVPFYKNRVFTVCQGYNGQITHHGQAHLDITVGTGGYGPTGCYGKPDASTGHNIYAPAKGTVKRLGSIGACVSFGSRSIAFYHLRKLVANGNVKVGAFIGEIAAAGQAGNGGYAHVHVQGYRRAGCTGSTSPFTSTNGLRFIGVRDMPYSGAANQYSGVQFKRTS